MQILTRHKKLLQTIATIIFIVVSVIGLYAYRVHQVQTVKPRQLFERLTLAAREGVEIHADDYDRAALAEQETDHILAGLQQDLANVQGINAETMAQYLLPEASGFLNDTNRFEPWLRQVLSELWQQDSDWIMESISTTERKILIADTCLLLILKNGHWQLTSIAACEALPE